MRAATISDYHYTIIVAKRIHDNNTIRTDADTEI